MMRNGLCLIVFEYLRLTALLLYANTGIGKLKSETLKSQILFWLLNVSLPASKSLVSKKLYVKPEVHDIAILNDVGFAFNA